MNIKDIVYKAHNTARDKGWWDNHRSDAECIALIHSELSEALEVWRSKDPRDFYYEVQEDGTRKPEGWLVELADVVIRVADLVGKHEKAREFDDAIREKLVYNESRPYKHGKRL